MQRTLSARSLPAARRWLPAVLVALGLTACAAGPVRLPPSGNASSEASPERPYTPPARQFRLGTAATALVAQAHAQAMSGEYAVAGATLERALRIEPENPLLWVELGRVQMGERNASQADGMGRKALVLATGDPSAQASAWRLIADSLRAQGRSQEAAEAERHAASLTPR